MASDDESLEIVAIPVHYDMSEPDSLKNAISAIYHGVKDHFEFNPKSGSEASPGTEVWGIFTQDTPSAKASSLGSFIPEPGGSGNSETSLKRVLLVIYADEKHRAHIEDALASVK